MCERIAGRTLLFVKTLKTHGSGLNCFFGILGQVISHLFGQDGILGIVQTLFLAIKMTAQVGDLQVEKRVERFIHYHLVSRVGGGIPSPAFSHRCHIAALLGWRNLTRQMLGRTSYLALAEGCSSRTLYRRSWSCSSLGLDPHGRTAVPFPARESRRPARCPPRRSLRVALRFSA